jgi:hypothetical protein
MLGAAFTNYTSPESVFRGARVLISLLLAATFLGACGSSSSPPQSHATATPLPTPSATPTGGGRVAQVAEIGPEPGEQDPVGAPANYITLRSDDLAVGTNPIFNVNQLTTYAVNNQSQLTTKQVSSGTGVWGLGNSSSSLTASGRFLGQDNDQLISVGRSADGTSVEVRFALGGAYDLPGLQPQIPNTPDLISVAAGDLDKVEDTNGVNHDEVVVAYTPDSKLNCCPEYRINLAVLNYTESGSDGSSPSFVTQTQFQFSQPTVLGIGSPPLNYPNPISELFSVAVGDFDGDGQNEIVVAAPAGLGSVQLLVFRYIHESLDSKPELVPATTVPWVLDTGLVRWANPPGGTTVVIFLPTISAIAGNFAGTANKADLVLALQASTSRYYTPSGGSGTVDEYPRPLAQIISFDSALRPTLRGRWLDQSEDYSRMTTRANPDLTAARIVALSGVFRNDPTHNFNLYRREIALVYNKVWKTSNDVGATLSVRLFEVNSDLSLLQQLGSTLEVTAAGTGAKFAATAGGLAVDSNLNTPLWSLGIAQLTSGTLPVTVTTVDTSALTPKVASVNTFPPSACCTGTTLANDNQFRPSVQATDFRGRTAFFGAPVRITVNNLINTDFVLEEPPKHAYWDESKQQLIVVSRVPTIAATLSNTSGVSFAGKSTDMSALSLGGSLAVSGSTSVTTSAVLAKTTVTGEVSAKASYSYDRNMESYNSNYSSRTLTETQSTDNDDFISGRAQLTDIWRYRALPLSGQEPNGNVGNVFYDVVLPGPVVKFAASGSDLYWYQPIHENGNILSYPAPTANTFTPPDVGTYEVPCPSPTDSACNPDGTLTQSGEMIPSSQQFISNTSGTIGLDYTNSVGSGDTVSYQHKLSTSYDVKLSYSAQVKAGVVKGATSYSVGLNLNAAGSWGNTSTSDSTTTSAVGIAISRSAISSAHAYAFFPTLYTTLDGTIKVAEAADPLGSSAGRSFWAGLYGAKPDPALNLPLRFVRTGIISPGTDWIPNEVSSRKLMRGFFVLSNALDPITGEYDILAAAPTDGDQVRLSAQVYNYSTGKSFSNCLVQFYAIKYDSESDTEIGSRHLVGSTVVSLPPRGTTPVQIIWDTAGFGGSSGGQDYRIYIDLNYDNKIDEIYPPEDPAKTYGPGLPVGLDPGQNDEGWGLVTVMAPASAKSAGNPQPADVYFGATPLVVEGPTGPSDEGIVMAGQPVELRAELCTHNSSPYPVDLAVFDGDPAAGSVIAWKRLYLANQSVCEGTWFNWTPSKGAHQLEAVVLSDDAPPTVANNVSTNPVRIDLPAYILPVAAF